MRSQHPLDVVIEPAAPLGAWVKQAACASTDVDLLGVYTADSPDERELALALEVCAGCPVQAACAEYAARVPVYGLWGAKWRGRRTRSARAAKSDVVRSTSGAGAVA